MIGGLTHWWLFRYIAIAVIVAYVSLIPAESGFTQMLPRPGQVLQETPRFTPILMTGLRVDPRDPFNLYFVMSDGDKRVDDEARRFEYKKLVKYFMASLITPNTDMWVNLSPQEAHRIIPDNFSVTEMGRDMLAQDYLLKQFTASLLDPKTSLGKEFWGKIYQKVYEIYGTTQIEVDTFNKVWITADQADVYQRDDTALLVKSHLKVMLEQDFQAADAGQALAAGVLEASANSSLPRQMVMDIVRQIIIPVIEQEVNEGAHFAPLRQMYNSMILATWFKKALHDSLLGQVYADTSKVAGIELNDPEAKERIYQQYLEAYKTGVFDYIQEELDEATQELLPRHYFAGGISAVDVAMINTNVPSYVAAQALGRLGPTYVTAVTMQTTEGVGFSPYGPKDEAQKAGVTDRLARVSQQSLLAERRSIEAMLEVAELKGVVDKAQRMNVDASGIAWFQRVVTRVLAVAMLSSSISPSWVNAAGLDARNAAQELVGGVVDSGKNRNNQGAERSEAEVLAAEIRKIQSEIDRKKWEKYFSQALKKAIEEKKTAEALGVVAPRPLSELAAARAAWVEDKKIRLIRQDPVAVPIDRNLSAKVVPVSFTPDPVGVANVDHELNELLRLVTQQRKVGLPVSLMLLGSNNALDISTQVGLGKGWSIAVVPDLPFRNLLSGMQIGKGLADFQAQSPLNKFLGPLFGLQLLADFGNWFSTAPVQGQDIMYDTSGKGPLSILVNTTGIKAYKDDGTEYESTVASVGFVDAYMALIGQLDKYLLGDNGLMGDSTKSFPFEDAGYVVKPGSYHEGFLFSAAMNKNPNVFSMSVFEVVDGKTAYRKNKSGGWDKASDGEDLGERRTYRQAKVTGVVFRYDPQTKEMKGFKIFTGPTFVSDGYMASQKHANAVEFRGSSGDKQIFFQRQLSIEDMLNERALLKGKDKDGRIVLGALRHPVTGRIVELVTDPKKLNELSSITDGDGSVVRFLPGKEFQGQGSSVMDYPLSQLMSVYEKWINLGGNRPITKDYSGKDITDSRPELTQMPDILKPLLGGDTLMFDPSGLMDRIDALGQANIGVLYSLTGSYPQVLADTLGLVPIKAAYESKANNVDQITDSNGSFVGGYEIRSQGKMMPHDALVSFRNGSAVGVLDMSKRQSAAGGENVSPAYDEGRQNWGVLIDISSGNITSLMQPSKNIRTAEALGWVGQTLTVYDAKRGKKNIVVGKGMLFYVDTVRKQVAIYEPGLKAMQARLELVRRGLVRDQAMVSDVDKAQASGFKSYVLALANIVMLAVALVTSSSADATSMEDFRKRVIADAVQRANADQDKKRQTPPSSLPAKEIKFKAKSVQPSAPVVAKDIGKKVVEDNKGAPPAKAEATEAKAPLYNLPVTGKGVLTPRQFLEKNILIVWKSVGRAPESQWVSREAILGPGETIAVTNKDGVVKQEKKDNILSGAQELLAIGSDGKTVGRVVKVYSEGYKIWASSEAEANLKNYYMAVPKDGYAPVQFITERQMQENWDNLRWHFNEFQKIALVKGQTNTKIETSIYPRFGEGFAEAEVVTPVSDTELHITKVGDRKQVVAKIQKKNELDIGGQHVRIMERRLASGALEKTYGSIVPREGGKSLAEDGKAGTLFVQLFTTQFKEGNPVKGLAIVGYLEQDRDIFEFSIKDGKYSIGSKAIGKAARYPHLELDLADVVRMFPVRPSASGEMTQVNPHVAEELDEKGKFVRAFFIDRETNEELGVINKIAYGEDGKHFYEVTAYPEKDKFVSYIMEGEPKADGQILLRIVQKVASAYNLPPMTLESLQSRVGILSGKLADSARNIAREIGVDFENIKFVPSLKVTEGNGQNIFYRIQGDPLARIIVFQSTEDPLNSSFTVNVAFDALKQPTQAYEITLLGETNYVETTPQTFSLEQLNDRTLLSATRDLSKYEDQLSYRRFNQFIEITKWRLPLGLRDEAIKDKILVRYIAAGDPLALDLMKVEGGDTVRIMKYQDASSLRKLSFGPDGKELPVAAEQNRPVFVVAGEVAVNTLELVNSVVRVTEWVRNDPKGFYIYKSTYEKDAGGVDFFPGIEITYEYRTGVVREAFLGSDYLFYSLEGIPLINRSSEPHFWNIARWFSSDERHRVERDQSAFSIKVQDKDGLVYRLVQEINIAGTTPKTELMSTLYINGYPVAVQKGKEIRVNVFKTSWPDVMRNGIPGKIMASVGLDGYVLGFNIDYQNGQREVVTVNVKDVIEKLAAVSQSGNGVHVLNVPAAKIKSLVGTKEPYTNWLRDWVLQPEIFAIPVLYSVLIALFMFLKEPFRWLRRERGGDRLFARRGPLNANTLVMDDPRIAKGLNRGNNSKDAAQRFTDNKELVEKLALFMATNNTIVVRPYKKDQEAQEMEKAKERAEAAVKQLSGGSVGGSQVKMLGPIEITGDKDVAAERLEAVLRPSLGFFTDTDIQVIKKAFKSGELTFDDVNIDPESDMGKVPKFDINEIKKDTRGKTSALPVLALRYALDKGWISENDLNVQIAEILGSSEWQYEHGAKWGELFSRVRLKLFEDAVKDHKRLDMTFPDPEVNMYKSLLKKGYTDLQAFVLDAGNGVNAKQRVERYVVQRILLPMVTQMRMEIPGLGSSMKSLRTAPFENNVISEFYRFAMINPEILPAAAYRTEKDGVYSFNNPTVFDVEYNINPMMPFSEPNTFREKLVQTLLMMPPSETDEISLGPVSAIAPMTMFLTRRLIRDLQNVEQSEADGKEQKIKKQEILRNFKEHTRFWKGAFASSNWTSLLGTGMATFGLFKRITEPAATQPDLFIKEIFHDEYMYYFFEQLQVQGADPYAEYDAIMDRIMHNDEALIEQLLLAYKAIGFLKGLVAKTGDPDFKSYYQKQVADWETDIKRLLGGVGINVERPIAGLESERQRALAAVGKGQVKWQDADRLRAAALASESLLWIIASTHNSNRDNEKLEDFVRGSFTNVLGPVLQKLKQLRFERNPYAHFVNELTSTWKGDRHMWLFRRIVPKYGMALASKWLADKSLSLFGKKISFGLGMASSQFREGEFSRSRSARKLWHTITSQEVDTEQEAVTALNSLVVKRALYQESWVPAIVPRLSQEDQELYARAKQGMLGNNGALWERLNRRLIEAGFYLDAPLGIVAVDGQGKSVYKKQTSLENYYGIKSPWVRAAVVTARVVLTGAAVAVGYFVSAGLGVILAGFAWAVLPRLLGKTKTDMGKRFWLSVTGMGIFNIALTAELLFGKFLAVKMLVAGTAVTAGLWVLLIPVALMTLYLYELGTRRASTYRNNVWLDYWKRRTVGIVSWLSAYPIKSGWWGQNNAGKFFGQVLMRLIKTQRDRGVLLPAGMLIQDKLMEDIDKLSRHHLLHPEERRALEASVNFIARYPDDEKLKSLPDAELKELLRLALAYEQALGEMRALPGYKAGKEISRRVDDLVKVLSTVDLEEDLTDTQKVQARKLIALKRPVQMITPQDPKAQEQMYTNFEVMVLKKPREDAFARLQGVSTHEQAYNETATYPLEKYGLHGTGNIVGLREFMPQLREEFSVFLRGNTLKPEHLQAVAKSSHKVLYSELQKNGVVTPEGWVDAGFQVIPAGFRKSFPEITDPEWTVIQEILMVHKRPTMEEWKLKDGKLVAAFNNMSGPPITRQKMVTAYRSSIADPGKLPHVTAAEADWLTARLQKAVEDQVISETSLLGYNLRKAFEMRENMLAALMEGSVGDGEVSAFTAFAAMIRAAEESDDIVVLFRDWAKGKSGGVVKRAEEALSVFMNEILPNNISMVEDISEDVYYVHLSAAAAYGDFEYYRSVQKMFRQYHSLKLAAEQEFEFREKFEQYQKSAKLKTTGMLQFGLIWASGNGFRLFEDFEKNKTEDPLDLTDEEKEQYKYIAMSWNGIPKDFKDRFKAILNDPQYGVKFAKSAKGREVVLVKDMRDYARAFMRFRSENYVDILDLGAGSGFLSDTYEVMRYVEESARSEALIPFYDGRKDNLIPGNKNGGINMNVWMNYGRSWNMDAAVRGYLGQNVYRLLYASYVGRNPEVVIANPAFRVWSSTNDAYPGVQRYKVAQETFTQEVQSSLDQWATFYGKGGVFQPAGNAFFTTPGEDSANYIMSLAMYVDLVARQFSWMVWDWGRPSLHTESIMGTEFRYVNNVTRFEMDIGLFELYLNPDVGYDMKLANDHMFNHYLFASVASALLIFVPMMQGFSGFAFLAPIAVFVPLTFLAMQAINNLNFFRHWREEGSVLLMLFTGSRDIAKAFSYYVSMHTMFTKARLLATNETFRFVASVKTMILGFLDRDSRAKQTTLEWIASKTPGYYMGLKKAGKIFVGLGAGLLAASFVVPIMANVWWIGSWAVVLGALKYMTGFLIEYQQKELPWLDFNEIARKNGVAVQVIKAVFVGAGYAADDGVVSAAGLALADPDELVGTASARQTADKLAESLAGATSAEDRERLGAELKQANELYEGLVKLQSRKKELFIDLKNSLNKSVGPIALPFDYVIGFMGIASWFVGFFFTTTLGPLVTILYLLAAIAPLTGRNVNDVFARKVAVGEKSDGTPIYKVRMSGENYVAFFSDHPRWFWTLLGSAIVVSISGLFLPAVLSALALPALAGFVFNGAMYVLMGVSLAKGALSGITSAFNYLVKDITRFVKEIQTEKKTRLSRTNSMALAQKYMNIKEVGLNNTGAVLSDAAQQVAMDQNNLMETALSTAQHRAEYWANRRKALGVKAKYLQGAIGQQERDQAQVPDPLGGISLNDANLTININVDNEGVPLPLRFQNPLMVEIQGLSPVIRNITPVNSVNMPVLTNLRQMVSSS